MPLLGLIRVVEEDGGAGHNLAVGFHGFYAGNAGQGAFGLGGGHIALVAYYIPLVQAFGPGTGFKLSGIGEKALQRHYVHLLQHVVKTFRLGYQRSRLQSGFHLQYQVVVQIHVHLLDLRLLGLDRCGRFLRLYGLFGHALARDCQDRDQSQHFKYSFHTACLTFKKCP